MLWVGTKEGLNRIDLVRKQFTSFDKNGRSGQGPTYSTISSIAEDARGNLWLAYAESSIDILDKSTQRFIRHSAEDYDPDRLHGGRIDNIFIDRRGVIWLVAFEGRLNKYDENAYKFNLYRNEISNPRSIPMNSVQTVFQDKRNQVWFDGATHGIFRYSRETDDFQRFPMEGNSHRPFLEDSEGTIWLGGTAKNQSAHALFVLDRNTMLPLREYILPKATLTADILEDPNDKSILWFTTNEQGLGQFNKQTKEFRFFSHDPQNPKSISSNSLWELAFDVIDNHLLWIGSLDGGLVKFDTRSLEFTSYTHDAMNPTSISSNAVYSFKQTKRGDFWVMAKGGGLEKFDRKSGKFEHFNQRNGRFPMDKAVNILEDHNGLLWLNAPGGNIIRFNPVDGAYHMFTKADGVQGGAAWAGGNLIDSYNRIWFTGGLGINAFYPDDIRESQFDAPLYFTAITQAGKSLVNSSATELVSKIELDWDHNFFEFEVISLDFTHAEQNEYQYKLEGWDQSWYNAGTRNHGRYSGLPGGEYVLHVRGTNSDHVWSRKEAKLFVIVHPPFWQTWWFYSIIIGVSMLAIFMVFRQRTNAIRLHNEELKLRSEELERRVTERTLELKRVMEQLLQTEKLAALGHLVAGVAHELNTPLGNARLVGSSMSDWIKELNEDVHAEKIKRSNLLRFVELSRDGMEVLDRNLMWAATLVADFKEIAVLQNDEQVEEIELEALFRNLFETIRIQNEFTPFDYTIDIQLPVIFYSYPRAIEQVFRKLICNSMIHGFQQKPGGTIYISAALLEATKQIQIEYRDNGVGIDPQIRHRIFEPFFTTQLGQGGSGLGLYIVHNIVNAVLGGSIEVLADPQNACVFRICLPMDQSDP